MLLWQTLNNVDESAAECNLAWFECEKSVILAYAAVLTWFEFRAALTDDNRPSLDSLAAISLDSTMLGIAVATVPGRALSLLMCHLVTP